MVVLRLSDTIVLACMSYLRHLEELGIETTEYILYGVLEDILLRVKDSTSLGSLS